MVSFYWFLLLIGTPLSVEAKTIRWTSWSPCRWNFVNPLEVKAQFRMCVDENFIDQKQSVIDNNGQVTVTYPPECQDGVYYRKCVPSEWNSNSSNIALYLSEYGGAKWSEWSDCKPKDNGRSYIERTCTTVRLNLELPWWICRGSYFLPCSPPVTSKRIYYWSNWDSYCSYDENGEAIQTRTCNEKTNAHWYCDENKTFLRPCYLRDLYSTGEDIGAHWSSTDACSNTRECKNWQDEVVPNRLCPTETATCTKDDNTKTIIIAVVCTTVGLGIICALGIYMRKKQQQKLVENDSAVPL